MPRQKYQRPEVHLVGKRKKVWRGEWKEYHLDSDGKQAYRHRAQTWPKATHTKAEAQAKLDAIIRELQQGGVKRDGSMTLTAFWEEIYYPVRSGRWAVNSRRQVEYLWRKYIKSALGNKPLNEIGKSDVDLGLLKVARQGAGQDLVSGIRKWIHSILEEALDNELIPRNPARKVQVPMCKPKPEVRSLTEAEVRMLWDMTTDRDYVIWRVLLLTGARIGEVLALTRTDLLGNGLVIDESALDGRPSTTKNKKTRLVPIPVSLRSELEEWLGEHNHSLMFPTPMGKMHRRSDIYMREMLERARTAAKIPDLTFRMCRTTFTTLFNGDIRDAQEILGHHSAAFTLQVYRKPVFARQQQAIDELDSRLKIIPIRKGVA